MKKLILISFALALVMSLLAFAQEATKPSEMKQEPMKAEKASAKAVSLSGKVSDDGKTFRPPYPDCGALGRWRHQVHSRSARANASPYPKPESYVPFTRHKAGSLLLPERALA
jgi:hypothetical protein